MVLTGASGEDRPAFVERASSENVATERFARAARIILAVAEIASEQFHFFEILFHSFAFKFGWTITRAATLNFSEWIILTHEEDLRNRGLPRQENGATGPPDAKRSVTPRASALRPSSHSAVQKLQQRRRCPKRISPRRTRGPGQLRCRCSPSRSRLRLGNNKN